MGTGRRYLKIPATAPSLVTEMRTVIVRSISSCLQKEYFSLHRGIYFKEVAPTIMEPGKFKIRRVGLQARDPGEELMLQLKSKGCL